MSRAHLAPRRGRRPIVRPRPRLDRAVAGAIEALEGRILFGDGHPYPSTPLDTVTPPFCPAPAIEADPNTGNESDPPAQSDDPIRYFDGKPVVTSTDLVSNGFGDTWGHVRTWTGLNESSQNGNGWGVVGLPYLTIPRNQAYGGMLTVSDGGGSNGTFDIASSGAITARGRTGSTMKYVLPYTDGGGNKMPGAFSLADSKGRVTTFYDVPRRNTVTHTDSSTGTTYDGVYTGGGYIQAPTHQHLPGQTSTAAYRFGARRTPRAT
jgi:hypothetical protein